MSHSQPNSNKWLPLTPMPEKHLSHITFINHDEFIITPIASKNNHIDESGIYKYSSNENMWIKIINYQKNLYGVNHMAALNKTTNILYLYTNKQKLYKINLKDNKWQIIKSNINIGEFSQCVIMNNKFHIIGGSKSNKHFNLFMMTKQKDLINYINLKSLQKNHQ